MTRSLTIGVRAVVRSEDGQFLLVRHSYTPGWHLPGGGIEKGETAEQALSRELFQEIGVRLVGSPVLHGVFHNSAVSTRDHVLVYLCSTDLEVPVSQGSMEISEVGYFGLDGLPKNIDPGTERRIKEITNGIEKGQTW